MNNYTNNPLIFYELMKYPVPLNQEYFYYIQPKKELNTYSSTQREKFTPYHQEYIDTIKQYERFYKSLPRVEEIYLSNSITFNALHKNSDIDLFIITTPGRLWTCRLISVIFFTLMGIRRFRASKKKKFCLSFYITQDKQNLYEISLKQGDIYLTYWIAHLVWLYKKTKSYQSHFFSENKRILNFLPNHPLKPIINIWSDICYGATRCKSIIEFFWNWILWNIVETSIKFIRLPWVLYQKKNLGSKGRGIIITDTMLKFHGDIRRKIASLYSFSQETQKK